MIVKLRLKEILKERDITQKELAEMTNMRPNTISDMVKNTRDTINRHHVGVVAKALGITDVSEIMYLEEE